MGTFTSSPHRGGADRYIADRPAAPASLENERDLALAIRARDRRLAEIQARRINGLDVHPAVQATYNIAKSIAWQLQGDRRRWATPKQRAFLMKVLGLETLPPIASTIPEACRVLPLKPPGR